MRTDVYRLHVVLAGTLAGLLLSQVYTLTGSAATLNYRETAGGKVTTTHTYVSEPSGAGSLVRITVRRGEETDQQTVEQDAAGVTVSWKFQSAKERTVLTGTRKGNAVHVSGTFKGKPVEKDFDTGGHPWRQIFPARTAAAHPPRTWCLS